MSTTITRSSRQYSLNSSMDSAADKEERKREYNRLAQREFRRRRKEHLRNLEQAQKEQSSGQSEEIERLRYQNDELRRENESLRAQIYGASSSSHGMLSTQMAVPTHGSDARQYSLSPSISGTSMSATSSPPATMGSDMMPMAALSLTSSMLPPSMQAYADPILSSQPYSMVQQSGLRHSVQKSSPDSSGFRNTRSTMGPPFQSLNISSLAEASSSQMQGQRGLSGSQPPNMVMVPYDRNRARTEIMDLFRPIHSDPSVTSNPDRHLAVLHSMSDSLPLALKPSKAQLETPHYYGIDMIASPSLRERLITLTADVARSFVADLGIAGEQREEVGQVIIWGDDALNEMSWELSQPILEKWDWLVGPMWKQRANFWRRQRGAPLLPEW